MLPEKTPAQNALVRSGIPAGTALLLVAGGVGLLLDSTFAGLLAGAGLMMIIGSLYLRKHG